MEEPPPITLAWVYQKMRSFMCLCGTVDQPQEAMPLVILAKPAGMWMRGCQSLPPASSSSTELVGSSESLLARTQPAAPPPTMMKSVMVAPSQFRHRQRTVDIDDRTGGESELSRG